MPITISTAGRVESQLSGTAGITTWPTAAAYASGVSLAEALAYVQDGVRKGTGTAMAANKSVADALGTDGTTITDSAVSVLGVIGSDTGTTAFASTSVAANEDGNVLERLEQLQEAVNKGSGTAIAANKSIADAIGFDGSAVVAATAGMLRVMTGTTFVVKKTLTSSAVVQAGVDVTAVSTVGAIAIESVHCMTDGTGLAAGTLFTLETDNAKGKAVFLTEAVADLGATATEISYLGNAGTTDAGSFAPILETGKKVIAKCTAADCTGVGTIDVYLVCRRLADNAALTAAA